MTKNQWRAAGVIVAVVALAGVYYVKMQAPVGVPLVTTDTASSSLEVSGVSATSSEQAKVATVSPFPINAADTIASWSFKGGYTGNETLTQQANADIAHLTGLLGKGSYDDYDLYNGLANDYSLLGNGTIAYQDYNRALAIHPTKGLVFVNLAHLLDQLGAYHTAADAYKRAVTVEPSVLEYHIERLNYLTRQFPSDTALITAAFTDASKVFGDTAPILSVEAKWLTGLGRYADAIKAWQTVKMLSPGKDVSAIDTEIARLKAKQ